MNCSTGSMPAAGLVAVQFGDAELLGRGRARRPALPAWKCISLRSQSRNSLARRTTAVVLGCSDAPARSSSSGLGRAVADQADPADQLDVAQRAPAIA